MTSSKIKTLEFGISETEAGYLAFHLYAVDSVPHRDEAEPAASKAIAVRRLIELLDRVFPQTCGTIPLPPSQSIK